MTSPKYRVEQNSVFVFRMMERYRRRVGDITSWHTLHDVSYRTGLSTEAAKGAIALLLDIGVIKTETRQDVAYYCLAEAEEGKK